MASDEEVEQQREAVVRLRAQLEEARTGGAEKLHELNNDIALAQLREEEARLQAELATAKENKKVTVLRQGAAPVLGTVKEQMAAAVAHQKAVEKEIASNKSSSTVTPTDADETNNTTDKQASNKAADKTEGAGK